MAPSVVVIAGAAVFLGAVVQGTVGFGVNLLAAPVIVFLQPGLMPVSLLIVGTVMPLITWWNEHEHVDHKGVGWALAGRAAGTLPGVWIVAVLPPDQLGIAIAILILLTVALTLLRVELQVNRTTLAGAGFLSAIAGTTAGIGGPPLGLVYQRSEPPMARATTAVVLAVGSLISMAGLGLADQIDAKQVWAGLALVPCLGLGFAVALRIRNRFQGESFRRAILVIVVLSAIAVLVRSALDSVL